MEGLSAKKHNNASQCIAEVLECSVCYEQMVYPKMLPCQHTFCLSCLDKIANYDLKKISCAICRSQHYLPIAGVMGFSDNLTLVRLIDSIFNQMIKSKLEYLVMDGLSAKNQNIASKCIAEVLECSVCYKQMVHPKMLPCKHTFCLSCLDKITNYYLKKISCAICGSQHYLPIGGVKWFPNNLTLASLIDSICDSSPSETSTSTVTVFIRGSILPVFFLQISLMFQSFALLKSSFVIN